MNSKELQSRKELRDKAPERQQDSQKWLPPMSVSQKCFIVANHEAGTEPLGKCNVGQAEVNQ